MKLRLPGLLSRVTFFGCRAAAAIETQGRIALLQNAEAAQGFGFLRQIKLVAMLGNHHAAGREKIRGTQES